MVSDNTRKNINISKEQQLQFCLCPLSSEKTSLVTERLKVVKNIGVGVHVLVRACTHKHTYIYTQLPSQHLCPLLLLLISDQDILDLVLVPLDSKQDPREQRVLEDTEHRARAVVHKQ